MLPNLIIFTTGSSGSSVLAGLIAQRDYWLGNETKKLNFDTYENAELVDLNIEILYKSGFKRRDCNDLPPPSVEAIRSLAKSADISPFITFLDVCNENQPWLWKDPRLAFTIHFWSELCDLSGVKFIFIQRDTLQSYAGLILSRKVPISYDEYCEINSNYEKSFESFLKSRGGGCLRLTFEDLLLEPQKTLALVNDYLGTDLKLNDLEAVYKGKLYHKRYSFIDYLLARFRYMVSRYVLKDAVKFPRGGE